MHMCAVRADIMSDLRHNLFIILLCGLGGHGGYDEHGGHGWQVGHGEPTFILTNIFFFDVVPFTAKKC